jgi:hypothetical protein
MMNCRPFEAKERIKDSKRVGANKKIVGEK